MRNKKVYYESGYKLTKGETESDLTKYLGGKAAHENLIANVEDVIESYKLMFISTALIVLMAFILAFIIANLNKANEGAIANNIDNNLRVARVVENFEDVKAGNKKQFKGDLDNIELINYTEEMI